MSGCALGLWGHAEYLGKYMSALANEAERLPVSGLQCERQAHIEVKPLHSW